MAERQEATAKVLLTVPEAAKRLGIRRTLMYELISTGQLGVEHLRGRDGRWHGRSPWACATTGRLIGNT